MAKGWKSGSNRHERFIGSFGYNQNHGSSTDNGSELGEEDVWSMVDGDDQVRQVVPNYRGPSSNGDHRNRNERWFAREDDDHRQVGGLSLAFENNSGKTSSSRIVHQFHGQDNMATGNQHGRNMAASAPVNVPDWTKILRVNSVESFHDSDDGMDDDDDSERVPPHEYLARGSRRKTTTSVFEGVGRTLKGRDLSRVRDAVWSQTGFDG